jgi:hypothetical protein
MAAGKNYEQLISDARGMVVPCWEGGLVTSLSF